MASSKFNKIQVGLQTEFGTPVTPTKQLPLRGTYQDQRQRHTAVFDAGAWTPTDISVDVAHQTALTLEGTAFYEVLPILLNSGFADVAPTEPGGVTGYLHTYVVSPAAVGVPMPLTALIGTEGTLIGDTGAAVKLYDLYLKTLTLSGNINDKAVSLKAEFFGTTYDDNTAAGYAFASVGLPASLQVINALEGTLAYKNVTTTGGEEFDTMTDFECSMLDWELVIDTGIEPAYCTTDAVLTWSALKYTQPSCVFSPVIRTSATTYALVKAAADAYTYQGLSLYIGASDATSDDILTVNMTGLWEVVPSAHEDQDGEVVMKPTFTATTPATQITTPHWLTITVTSQNNWT